MTPAAQSTQAERDRAGRRPAPRRSRRMRDGVAEPHLDAELLELRLGRLRQTFREMRPEAAAPASTSTTRAVAESMLRKSRTIALRASSAMAPASSTPVGPPPTMTKVSSLRRSSGSSVTSACSKAARMRARISVASPIVFRPGAASSHSSWPK